MAPDPAPSPRRPAVPPLLDEAGIARLVHAFYARARRDWLLGPVFEGAVDDWDAHLATLVRFWCSVLLRAGTYRGNPMAAHRPLDLDDQHFARWLALWDRTAHEVLPRDQARHVFGTAVRIGQSLRVGLEIDPLRRLRRDAGTPCAHHAHHAHPARPPQESDGDPGGDAGGEPQPR